MYVVTWWCYERISHTYTVPNPACSTLASGPREAKAGFGNRGARSTQNTVVSTAPPNEVASARKEKRGPTPPRRVLRGLYLPLTGPRCAPQKRFGTPGRLPVTTGDEVVRARESRSSGKQFRVRERGFFHWRTKIRAQTNCNQN
eukprot:5211296-Pyramimonas_sp.AAC.1